MSSRAKTITPFTILQMMIFIFIVPLLPLLISGRWQWWEGWVYALTGILGFAISRALASRRHPDLLKERARFAKQPEAKPWDKTLSPLVGLGSGLIPLVAGLDERLGWSAPFALEVKLGALLVFLAGYTLASYALIENRFFSGVVRIQAERGHQVVSSGPYRWIRHPGYAGAIYSYLVTPLFLDAIWAFIPVVLITALLVVRTNLEDRTLQEELAGYKDYTGQVRYRLLPGVW